MYSTSIARAPGHRRNDADLVTTRQASVETLTVPHVLAVDKHVHEPANLARVVPQSLPDPWMSDLQRIKDFADARASHDDFGLAARELAQWSGDEHGDARVIRHAVIPPRVTVSRNARVQSSGSASRHRSRSRRCAPRDPLSQARSQVAPPRPDSPRWSCRQNTPRRERARAQHRTPR